MTLFFCRGLLIVSVCFFLWACALSGVGVRLGQDFKREGAKGSAMGFVPSPELD